MPATATRLSAARPKCYRLCQKTWEEPYDSSAAQPVVHAWIECAGIGKGAQSRGGLPDS
jgi:hypothetical protein